MVDDNPPAPPNAESNGAAGDRLNSWKEIATYLGKGVRTVQRWEVQMGLPVRRLGREGGEIVYALKSEIHAWLLNGGHAAESDRLRETPEAPPEAAAPPGATEAGPLSPAIFPDPAAPPPAESPRFSAPRWAWASLVLVGIAGMAMTLAQMSGPGGRRLAARSPVGAVYETGVLRALDSEGTELWRLALPVAADNRLDTRMNLDPVREPRRIAVEDLDGDGSNEVIFIAVSPSGSGDSLHVYNADGSLRFTHIPGRPVTWGSKVFKGFNANSLHFLRDPDGSLGLWLTSSHVSWFPSLLQRLSPRGELLSEYWSNGVIRTIRPATLKGRPYLLVGGYNNETHGASLAFLEMDHASGAAPAGKPGYRCLDCADGSPAEFLVFPTSDVVGELTAGGGSATVVDARLTGDDEVVVTVHQGGTRIPGEADPVDAALNYTLSAADLQLKELQVLWGYLKVHKALEAVGRLKHTFGPGEEAELSGIVRWSRGRFMGLKDLAADPAFMRSHETTAGDAGSLRRRLGGPEGVAFKRPIERQNQN